MKIPSILNLATFGALLPFTTLRAAGPPGKTYGGFAAAQIFTLTVTDRDSDRIRGFRLTEDAPVPTGTPDFKEGQKVRFKIGNKGQLTGPGFSIRFQDERKDVNFYAGNVSGTSNRGNAATVTKGGGGDAKKATLVFFRYRFDGIIPVTHTVEYKLQRNP